MISAIRIFGIVMLSLLGFYTSSKLWKMAQIRGFLSGPAAVSKTITNKAIIEGEYADAYWVAWDQASVQRPGPNRMNLPAAQWEALRIGDSIEVLYFPGDRWPHHRDGIFASNENFMFDFVLLGAWLTGVAVLSFFQVRAWRQTRRSLPPPVPR